MGEHYHVSVDHVLIYGISAIIVINLGRILAAGMLRRGGAIGSLGESLGALVK